MYSVYLVKNKINGKVYIGKSHHTPEKRFKIHCQNAFSKKRKGKRNVYFHKAITKYGSDAFEIFLLEKCETNEKAGEKEIFYIKKFNSKNHNIGYNLTDGGEGVVGRKKSKEEIERLRQLLTGRKLSEEHKKKLSLANKGKIISEKTKEKISQKNSGSGNGMYGRPTSAETRKKKGEAISQAKRNKKHKIKVSDKTRQKQKEASANSITANIDPNIKDEIVSLYKTGKYIKRDISEKFNIPFTSIITILRNWEGVKERSKNKLTKAQKEDIVKMRLTGEEYSKISEVLGIDRGKIRNVCKRYRYKLKHS